MKTKTIDVEFGDNLQISANLDGISILTDQPVKQGGDEAAPTPFQLFLASLASCAGLYAKRFCETRKLSTEGLALQLRCEFAEKEFRVEKMVYELTLPEDFPEKYEGAIKRAIDLCTVKKHLNDAPAFEIVTTNGAK